MPLSDDLMRELLATFAVEAQEHLQAMGQHLLVLEKEPGPELEGQLLADIFREAHSLKGAARAVNLEMVGTVAHRLETLFARLRDGELKSTPALFDLVYQTLDVLGMLAISQMPESVDVASLLARLDAVGAQPTSPAEAPATGERSLGQRLRRAKADGPSVPDLVPTAPLSASRPVSGENASGIKRESASSPVAGSGEKRELPSGPAVGGPGPAGPGAEGARPHAGETTVRLSTAKLDALMEVVGELQAARLSAEQRLVELRALQAEAESWEAQARALRRRSRRLLAPWAAAPDGDGRMRETSALIEFFENNNGRIRAMRGNLSELRRHFEADTRRLAQLMADLQDDVRRTRLLPMSTVLDTFPRVVRDLARELEKEVAVVVQGGETEVDRAVMEQIKDPLTHLVRNAVDHGLESPAARVAAGKPAEGTLTLRAAQIGDRLQVEVRDDGAGIDVARVKASAVQHGLTTAEAAAAMSEREALWLIFRSGLSTSPIITGLSGRGVGLDVVRENVERLNGWIDVDSRAGQGTRFTFSLPLTVATTLCLLARVGGRTYGVPASSVVRVVRVGPEQIGHAEGGQAIRVDGRPVPLRELADVLEVDSAAPAGEAASLRPTIVLGSAERRAAFMVDALGNAQDVVVKSLPQPFERVPYVSGAAILGTGEITLILSAADLMRAGSRGGRRAAAAPVTAAKAAAPVILVADDSLTTRTLEKNILEVAGFEVRAAADGVEAWTILQSQACRLLVSDINMPRLNGFELTEKVRADEKLKHLPIILVTSLDSREDRERGIWAGADAYIVKGAFDQDVLLSTIRQLI